MTKYAPANENGEKPYVVEWSSWGRPGRSLVYAKDVPSARYLVIGRQRYKYATRIRRALATEVPTGEQQ